MPNRSSPVAFQPIDPVPQSGPQELKPWQKMVKAIVKHALETFATMAILFVGGVVGALIGSAVGTVHGPVGTVIGAAAGAAIGLGTLFPFLKVMIQAIDRRVDRLFEI